MPLRHHALWQLGQDIPDRAGFGAYLIPPRVVDLALDQHGLGTGRPVPDWAGWRPGSPIGNRARPGRSPAGSTIRSAISRMSARPSGAGVDLQLGAKPAEGCQSGAPRLAAGGHRGVRRRPAAFGGKRSIIPRNGCGPAGSASRRLRRSPVASGPRAIVLLPHQRQCRGRSGAEAVFDASVTCGSTRRSNLG